jgi:HAD superfamily hydrolase (TIGR01509 family)
VIKAIFCDLDGTLIDSENANITSYQRAFAAAGIEFQASLYRKNFGLRFKEMMAQVAPGADAATLDRISRLKTDYYRESLSLLGKNQALIDFLVMLKPSHKIALTTTAKKANAELALGHFGLNPLFDFRLFGEDVAKGKPDPECYLKCMAHFGARADECLVIEDTVLGAEAAKNAGIACIRVPHWNGKP